MFTLSTMQNGLQNFIDLLAFLLKGNNPAARWIRASGLEHYITLPD